MKKLTTGMMAGAAAGLVAGGVAAVIGSCCGGKRRRGMKTMKCAAKKALRGAEEFFGDMMGIL